MPRDMGAYPHLIPGAMEVNSRPWEVVVLDSSRPQGGQLGPSTTKEGNVMKVPEPVLQKDWWIRQHELIHVERPWMVRGPNKLRNMVRQMLEEVAVDGQAVNRDGLDLRKARDGYDWTAAKQARDVYAAVGNYFQVWTSAVSPGTPCTDPELMKYYEHHKALIADFETKEPKLAGLSDLVQEAAEACFRDYSSGNCEDWADLVTARLLGVPKEDVPNAPVPPPPVCGTPGPTPPGGGDEPGDDPGDGDESDEGQCGGTPGQSEPGDDDGDGTDDGSPGGASEADDETSQKCEVCEGEGVDEDGDTCPACGGEGVSGDAAGDDTDDEHDGSGDSGSGASASGDEGDSEQREDYGSEWDDAPIDLDKGRQNEPMEFGFDPLGKSEGSRPHDFPPEKDWKAREVLTRQAIEEEMERERVNRKAGEASQQPELTARTPHGAVDVHRHIMGKAVSASAANRWRSSQDGITVRYPSQMFPDGRVFAKRAPGGSIILDGSGSMDWHTQHIREAQKRMPNLYVAVYSYHGGNGYWRAQHNYKAEDAFIARYCIVAANGKLDPEGVTNRYEELARNGNRLHTGGNSGSDPASLWYAAKNAPKPIVWVSDGQVDFGEKQGFWQNTDSIMRQHGIVRVLTIEDAIDYLMGKAVPGWHQSATVDVKWVRLGQPMKQTRVSPDSTGYEAQTWSRKRALSRTR